MTGIYPTQYPRSRFLEMLHAKWTLISDGTYYLPISGWVSSVGGGISTAGGDVNNVMSGGTFRIKAGRIRLQVATALTAGETIVLTLEGNTIGSTGIVFTIDENFDSVSSAATTSVDVEVPTNENLRWKAVVTNFDGIEAFDFSLTIQMEDAT